MNFLSFKNYTVDCYKEALNQLNLLNYETFNDVNFAFSNFFQKIMTVNEKIASSRNKQIKRNTRKWFDSKVLEKLNTRDKLFKKFKKSRLNIDKELYKKS